MHKENMSTESSERDVYALDGVKFPSKTVNNPKEVTTTKQGMI